VSTNIYRGAIEVIEERGWSNTGPGGYGATPGNVCIFAALAIAGGSTARFWNGLTDDIRLTVADIISEQYPEITAPTLHRYRYDPLAIRNYMRDLPWTWNDNYATREKVLAVLEKAAVKEDERAK
jgi:hypothetical protein